MTLKLILEFAVLLGALLTGARTGGVGFGLGGAVGLLAAAHNIGLVQILLICVPSTFLAVIIAAFVRRRVGKKSRACVLGHLQRGGSPASFDRARCSMFGATAIELVAAGDLGKMVAYIDPQVGAIKLSEAVEKLKTLKPDGSLVRTARALGMYFTWRLTLRAITIDRLAET